MRHLQLVVVDCFNLHNSCICLKSVSVYCLRNHCQNKQPEVCLPGHWKDRFCKGNALFVETSGGASSSFFL